MASPRKNSRLGSNRLGSLLRNLIPARWRRPLTGAPRVARAVRTGRVDALAVRPPWWRFTARMMVRRANLTADRPDLAATSAPSARPLIKSKLLVAKESRLVAGSAAQTPSLARSSKLAAPSGPSLVARAKQPMPGSGGAAPGLAAAVPDPGIVARAADLAEPVATTPVQRWQAAIARVPLESARPFSADLRPMVAELAGSADRPSFTTGPATRAALQAAGAEGATTGSVIHLPEMPSARSDRIGVLAHELSHARNPVTRPRFLLRSASGAMDADERVAQGVGAQVRRSVADGGRSGASTASFPSAARSSIARSPSSASSSVARQTSVARNVGGADGASMLGAVVARSARGGSAQPSFGPQGNSVRRASVARSARTDQLAEQAQSVASGNDAVTGLRQRAQEAKTVAAGIVDTLPVGGAGVAGLVDAARPAALSSLGGTLPSALAGPASAVADEVSAGVTEEQQVIEFASGAVPGIGGALDELSNAGTQATSAATTQAAGLVSTATGAAQQVAAAVPGAAGAMSAADLDRITTALEERLLRQLERRGGRYAGVF